MVTAMRETARIARRMLERTGEHPVISVYFDLDPAEFATPPARETEVHSLIDEAPRPDGDLNHEDRKTLEQDFKRIESFLLSDDVPVSGSRAVAVFCSGQDSLFETVALTTPATARVVVAKTPFVEPMVVGHDLGEWCLALVDRRSARIFVGAGKRIGEREQIKDSVPGTIRGDIRHQRSVEAEADAHLRNVSEALLREWEQQRYRTLAVGGPEEDVDRLKQLLHNDLRPALWDGRVELDVAVATEPEVLEAMTWLLADAEQKAEGKALEELANRLGAGGAAISGLADTLEALAERRVETLLLARDFEAAGGRCPSCGLLTTEGEGSCPADGTALEPVPDLREAAVEAALIQDAEVLVVEEPSSEIRRGGGIAALLSF
jgi:peptide chain release factor subunit 1